MPRKGQFGRRSAPIRRLHCSHDRIGRLKLSVHSTALECVSDVLKLAEMFESSFCDRINRMFHLDYVIWPEAPSSSN